MTPIANSSILIALSSIGELGLLYRRFPAGIRIPQRVWEEVVEEGEGQVGSAVFGLELSTAFRNYGDVSDPSARRHRGSIREPSVWPFPRGPSRWKCDAPPEVPPAVPRVSTIHCNPPRSPLGTCPTGCGSKGGKRNAPLRGASSGLVAGLDLGSPESQRRTHWCLPANRLSPRPCVVDTSWAGRTEALSEGGRGSAGLNLKRLQGPSGDGAPGPAERQEGNALVLKSHDPVAPQDGARIRHRDYESGYLGTGHGAVEFQ